jgi:hypothetical protein
MALANRSNARAYPSKAASAAASEQTFGVSADFFAQWQEFDGELIVVDSRDPEHDLARALLARGLTGKVTMLDAQTGKPRTVVDIAKAAELCVSEESRDGLRIQAYRESPDSDSQAAEDDIVLPTIPPETNKAA